MSRCIKTIAIFGTMIGINRKRRRTYPRGYRRSNGFLERKNRRRTAVVSVALFGIIFLFSFVPVLSEGYMRVVYPVAAAGLSSVSGLFPFSLYDLFLIAAAIWLLMIIVLAIVRRRGFVRFLFSLLRFVTVIVAWFYFSWGIAYFREDFYARCNVDETAYDREQFRDFATRFIERANQSYINVTNVDFMEVDSAGEDSMPVDDMRINGAVADRMGIDPGGMDKKAIREAIETAYQTLHGPLRIAYPNGKRRVKPMLFETIYSKTGVSGYFGPFFNEIHVNNYSLDFTYPFTLAHEMAHQFGIGPESEANLYAFIVCAASGDDRVRYSAYASTLRYVLNDVYRFLPDEYESIYLSVRPEIIDDLRRNREHWLAARNESLSNAQDKMYDAYLKTNKVSSGQANYSEVVSLLVSSYDAFSPFFR